MRQRLFVVFAIAAIAAGLLPAVAMATNDGTPQTYIVLYKTTPSPKGNGAVIAGAGGTIVADYRAIGVVIARSSNPNFGALVRATYGVEGAASTAAFGVGLGLDEVTAEQAAEVLSGPVNDSAEPLWNLQWDMEQINTPDAHAITGGDSSVTVGDIDTGLDFTHPDIAPNYDAAKSADCSSGAAQPLAVGNDQNGHGTHTAGTIAAAANGIGIVGTAPAVKIAGIKSSNDDGFFFPEMVICAFMWAATHDIQVTNNSYFADPWLFNCANDPGQRAIWKAERRAISHAQSKGVTVVASAGNRRDDMAHPTQDVLSPDFPPGSAVTREITNACRTVPVEVAGVVGVSATGPTTDKARYSNYGSGVVDVAAPGGDSRCTPTLCSNANPVQIPSLVLSTFPAGLCPPAQLVVDQGATYCYLQGTSMAGPHAAGVAALIWSTDSNATAAKVGALLASSATPKACPTDAGLLAYYAANPSQSNGAPQVCTGGTTQNSFYGAGIIDAFEAITH